MNTAHMDSPESEWAYQFDKARPRAGAHGRAPALKRLPKQPSMGFSQPALGRGCQKFDDADVNFER